MAAFLARYAESRLFPQLPMRGYSACNQRGMCLIGLNDHLARLFEAAGRSLAFMQVSRAYCSYEIRRLYHLNLLPRFDARSFDAGMFNQLAGSRLHASSHAKRRRTRG